MYRYDYSTTNNLHRGIIQFHSNQPPPDTRPKTTNVTASLTKNFPLHKSGFYKNYRYSLIANNNRIKPLEERHTPTPNIANLNSNQILFPFWSKSFKPRAKTQNTQARHSTAIPHSTSYYLTQQTPITNCNVPPQIQHGYTRPQSKSALKQQPREDLPPLPKHETNTNQPPIRVTFKYRGREERVGKEKEAKDGEGITMQKYIDYLRREGHNDLTHNCFSKVEMWLAGLEKDGTWPVNWFTTKK